MICECPSLLRYTYIAALVFGLKINRALGTNPASPPACTIISYSPFAGSTWVLLLEPSVQGHSLLWVLSMHTCFVCVCCQSIFFPILLYSSNRSRSVESNVPSSPQYRSAVSCFIPLKFPSPQITLQTRHAAGKHNVDWLGVPFCFSRWAFHPSFRVKL